MVFLGRISKKLLYCGILHQHPQFFLNTKFHPKIKILKFGTKAALIGYFGLEFQKTNVAFEFVNMQSFIQKKKGFKLETKNTLFRYLSCNLIKTIIKFLISTREL